jgi:hypothetical protein
MKLVVLKLARFLRIETAIGRGVDLRVALDLHDVLEFGDRPVGVTMLHRARAVVNRLLLAQPVEEGPHGIGVEQRRLRDVILLQRD